MEKVLKLIYFKILVVFCFICASLIASNDQVQSLKIHPMSLFEQIGFHHCDSPGAGGLDQGELAVIQHLIKDNNIVFDVGANLGEWSQAVLNGTSTVIVYAFEPIPPVFLALQKRFISFSNFKVHQFALFSRNEEIDFCYYPDLSVLSTVFERKSVHERLKLNPAFIKVKTMRLDDFCSENEIRQIDFLKIDTEGSEVDILIGAQNMLSNLAINFIQFEYGGTYIDAHTTLKTVHDLLTPLNYSLYKISQYGLIEISQWDDRLENFEYSNFLAIKNDA